MIYRAEKAQQYGIVKTAVGLSKKVLLVCLGFYLSGASAFAQKDPSDTYLQFYIKVKEAEKLEKDGSTERALSEYQVAQKTIHQIKKESPTWKPGLVEFRARAVDEKIKDLTLMMRGGGNATISRANPPMPPQQPAPAPAPIPQPVQPQMPPPVENTTVYAPPAIPVMPAIPVQMPSTPSQGSLSIPPMPKVEGVAGVLQQLNEMIQQRDTQIQDLQRERDQLRGQSAPDQLKNELYQAQQKLQRALADRDKLAEEVRTKRGDDRDMDALRSRLARAESKVAAIRDSETEAIANLTSQLDATRERLQRMAKQNEELEKNLSLLTAKLNEAQQNLEMVQTQGGSSKESSLLQIENEMLRDIVQRQLEDQPRKEDAKRAMVAEFRRLQLQSDVLEKQLEILASPKMVLTEAQMEWMKNMATLPAPSISASLDRGPATALENHSLDESSASMDPPEDMLQVAKDAAAFFEAGNTEKAAQRFEEILRRHPANVYALSNLGVVRVEQRRYAEAQIILKKAVELAPSDGFSHSALGIAYFSEGKYDDAIELLTKAVAMSPSDFQTRNYLGLACLRQGRLSVAEREIQKAIELNPSYAEAHYNLAVIYASQNPQALDLAAQAYNKAVGLGKQRDPQFEQTIKLQGSANAR